MTACPVCRSPGRPLYRNLRDRLFGVPGSWTLDRCPERHAAWLSPAPPAEEIAGFYRDYYTHAAPAAGPPKGSVFRGLKRRLERTEGPGLLARAVRSCRLLSDVLDSRTNWLPAPPPGRLLDVGCADGRFLAYMKSRGWDVWGTDIDAASAALARERLGDAGRVLVGDARDLPLPEAGFDAITMHHVVEHVLDVPSLLRRLRALLKTGGYLTLETPNLRSLGHFLFRRDWMHLDQPRHLLLLDAGSMRRLLEEAGYQVETCRTTGRSAWEAYYVSRALTRRGAVPRGWPGRSIAGMLAAGAFHLVEHAALAVLPGCGEAVVAVARKRTA